MAKLLRKITANLGTQKAYRKKLQALIDEMFNSVNWWVTARYRENLDRINSMANDASPSREIEKELRKVSRRWRRNFNREAEKLGRWFIREVDGDTSAVMRRSLKKAGFTVEMTTNRVTKDVLDALIIEQVNLIKTIPQKFFEKLNTQVLDSVMKGRDIGGLTDVIEKEYKTSRKRAAFIARDQNNKATEAIKMTRDRQLGIKKGEWVHIPGAKSSRETHVHMDGEEFDLSVGIYDSAVKRFVKPGELPGCNCSYRAKIPEPGDDIK